MDFDGKRTVNDVLEEVSNSIEEAKDILWAVYMATDNNTEMEIDMYELSVIIKGICNRLEGANCLISEVEDILEKNN